MLTVLGGLAEFERSLILTRTGEGRARAMARSVRFGRKPKLTEHQVAEARARREAGEALSDVGRSFNVSHSARVPPSRLSSLMSRDRLARSIGDLQDIVRTVRARGAVLKATEQPIDTGTAAGKCFLDMLGVFAEFETNLRRERQLGRHRQGEGCRRLQGSAAFEASRVRELKARACGRSTSPRRSRSAGRRFTGCSQAKTPS
jgi:DNA invertase Pin-like site-specific DNA recombinase